MLTHINGAGLSINDYKDTDDYELYDPRINSLRGKDEGGKSYHQSSKRGPILVNRPPKNTKSKQEVCNNCSNLVIVAWFMIYS